MSDPPHVLMLPSWYPSRVQPTNGNFVEQHVKVISSYCRVSVLFLESDPNLGNGQIEKVYAEPSGVATWKVYYGKTNLRVPLLSDLIQFKQFLKAAWLGYRSLVANRGVPDLVHVHVLWRAGFLAYLLKKLKHLPYVASEHHTSYLTGLQNRSNKLTRSLIRRIGKGAGYILPVSADLKQAMRKTGISNNYKVIPNVVDPEVFYPAEKIPFKPFTFIHVSSLKDEQKHFSGIIEAVQALAQQRSDFVLQVITDSPDFSAFQKKIADKGLSDFFQFLPSRSPEGVAEAMRSSHCFVMFSYYETFGIVLAEALMCGVPAIFTDSGGLGSEIGSGDEGIQIKPGDITGLYQAMEYIMAHYSSFNTSKVADKYAERFKPSAVGMDFYHVYQQVLSS